MTFLLQRLRPPEKSATVTVEDALLASEAQADRRAFAAIYDRHFAGVYGIALDGLGNLYVTDWVENEYSAVQKFRLLPPLAP